MGFIISNIASIFLIVAVGFGVLVGAGVFVGAGVPVGSGTAVGSVASVGVMSSEGVFVFTGSVWLQAARHKTENVRSAVSNNLFLRFIPIFPFFFVLKNTLLLYYIYDFLTSGILLIIQLFKIFSVYIAGLIWYHYENTVVSLA